MKDCSGKSYLAGMKETIESCMHLYSFSPVWMKYITERHQFRGKGKQDRLKMSSCY